ncbi:protein DD3-3-like [Watersipora subatra]|uniref:protein DD3-3-like n=1 Tax=Watersipora subatra TaxID=2589382 RepID=UPI00355B10BD
MFYIFILTAIVPFVSADIYMHNPRGSNNRLDEEGRERNNANRVFDSQNNDRGGYNVGSLYYYEGSVLPIEWTNQHECGGPNTHCELIIQYMCSNSLRDGATTTTIPENSAQCQGLNCNTDLTYGMHEDFNYYSKCKRRQRNEGLFLADQKLKGKTAKYTRQNPGGTRRGYECPEERDYYPYWHPTPWRDLVIMTNNVSRCELYLAESENVKSRYECVLPYAAMISRQDYIIPNNEEDCLAFVYPANSVNGTRGEWKEVPSHGIPAPKCQETEFSRDNHLGNGLNGYPNVYNWTIPKEALGERCAIRIRYNISTGEYEGWDGVPAGTELDLSEKYGLESGGNRGYVLKNNPQVDIFNNDKLTLQMAINTAQYGRVFQDRSFAMAIRSSPELDGQRIYNVNVRGKRGNIVQVYPAVEYDFVPNTLEASVDDYIHIQWTGSNTNPKNNDGQGQAGSDRSNMVLQEERVYSEDSGSYWQGTEKYGHWGRSYPMNLDKANLAGLSLEDKTSLAILSPGQFRGELSELDDAGTYFDLGPKKVTAAGVSHYMCTRNNNFSNRSQKGKLVILQHGVAETQLGARGGELALPQRTAVLTVNVGVLSRLTYIKMEHWPAEVGHQKIKDAEQSLTVGTGYASDFVVISPENDITGDSKVFQIDLKLHNDAGNNVKVYRSYSQHFSSWEHIAAEVTDGRAVFQVRGGGVYVARNSINAGAIAAGVIVALAVVILVVAVVIYFRRKPEKWEAVTRGVRNAKRGTQGKV